MSRKNFPKCDGSPTKLKRYEGCPLSYHFRYGEKIQDPAGPEGRVGTLVHAALETVARARIQKDAPPPADAAELLAALGGAVPELEGATNEDVANARALLEQIAPFDVAAGGMVLLVEQDWTLDVGGGVVFGGFWDLLRRRKDGTLEVVDWKTGANAPSRDEAEVDPQVTLYLAAARDWHMRALEGQDDGREIVCTLAFIALDYSVRTNWTAELDVYARARARAAHAAWSRGHKRAYVSPNCARCFARDRCGPYREHVEKLKVVSDPCEAKDLPLPELLRQRAQMSATADLAEGRRRDLDRELRERMERTGQKDFEAAGFRAAIRERRSGNYDVALIAELAAELGRDPYDVVRSIGRVSAEGVKKLTKGNEAAQKLAERYRDPNKTRYVEVRQREGASV